MSVNMVQAGKNLVENALHAPHVHAFVISRFHQLIQVAVHVFHADVKLFAVRI